MTSRTGGTPHGKESLNMECKAFKNGCVFVTCRVRN
jgi:hypothetical protein